MRLLCALAVLLLVLAAAGAAPQSAPVNLALGRSYASSCATLPGWTGLVDGDKDSDSAPGCYATNSQGSLPRYVVIDLGADCSVSKVVVYNSGNGNTRTVSISSSVDGINYKKLREPDFIFTNRETVPLSISFAQPRQVHYVRLTFLDTWKGGLGGDNCMFIREVEVIGRRGEEKIEDPFAFAADQPVAVTNRSLGIFKRYCLEGSAPMKMTVAGDYFISGSEEEAHWARQTAAELARRYPAKHVTLTAVGGAEGTISYALDWAKDAHGVLAPDLVVLAYGAQAASVGADPGEFRAKYQALVSELADNTQALLVALTPPPFLQDSSLPLADKVKGRDSRPYAWAVEQVAQACGLPVLRTAAVLARTPGSKRPLYADCMHLSPEGQRALGLALADLLQ